MNPSVVATPNWRLLSPTYRRELRKILHRGLSPRPVPTNRFAIPLAPDQALPVGAGRKGLGYEAILQG